MMIEGWVDDILEECPLMMEVDGYSMNRHNDECEESIQVLSDSIIVKYGDFITFSFQGFQPGEAISLKSSSPSERITVYYEDSQSHTMEGAVWNVGSLCRCFGYEGGVDSVRAVESATGNRGVEVLFCHCAVCHFGMRRVVC